MPHAALSAAVARILRAAAPPAETDGRLLARFVATRDGDAFAELVRRIGPLVLGVCRRVTGDRHLADDAFQAAFLVLARRAADVRPRDAVRPFLYGVAVRVAREARSVSARRRAREVPVPVVPDRAADPPDVPDAHALRLLDEEVATLPDHLRAAVVLCELDGLGRKDAAERLGVPEGTLSSRLAKARKLLGERLRKRGLALPAVGLGVLAGSAPVSARLASATSALASPGAAVPAAVAALTTGVFRIMLFHKLTAAGLAAVVLAAWALAANPIPPAAPPKPAVPLVLVPAADDKKPEPVPPAGPGTLVAGREGAFWVLTPDGKKLSDLEPPEKTRPVGGAMISPDGKRVAFVVNAEEGLRPPARAGEEPKPWPLTVIVRKLDQADGGKECELTAFYLTVRWTADGKKLVASLVKNRELSEYETVLLDPETGKTEKIDLPAAVRVLDCAKDGKTFLVQTFDAEAKKSRLGIAKLGDKEVTVLCDLRDRGYRPTDGRLSPDGKRVLFVDGDPDRKDAHKWGCSQRVYLLDLGEKKPEPLTDFPDNGRAAGVAWSPDGKKIAYTWTPLDEEILKKDRLTGDDVAKETEGFLMVADADGRNAKTVATDKGRFALNMILGAIDWK